MGASNNAGSSQCLRAGRLQAQIREAMPIRLPRAQFQAVDLVRAWIRSSAPPVHWGDTSFARQSGLCTLCCHLGRRFQTVRKERYGRVDSLSGLIDAASCVFTWAYVAALSF